MGPCAQLPAGETGEVDAVSRSARGVEGMRMPVAENRGQEEGGQASPGLHP